MVKKNSNQALRKLYAQGKRFEELRVRRLEKGGSIHGALAAQGAITDADKNRLMEARKFASLYTEKDLDWLCSLGEKVGRPITRCHVQHLIRVRNAKQRKELAAKCATESWSVRKLQVEIARIQPGNNYGGAKHKLPETTHEALFTTERMARSWINWMSILSVADKSGEDRVTLASFPESVRKKMHALEHAAKGLSTAIAKQLERQR